MRPIAKNVASRGSARARTALRRVGAGAVVEREGHLGRACAAHLHERRVGEHRGDRRSRSFSGSLLRARCARPIAAGSRCAAEAAGPGWREPHRTAISVAVRAVARTTAARRRLRICAARSRMCGCRGSGLWIRPLCRPPWAPWSSSKSQFQWGVTELMLDAAAAGGQRRRRSGTQKARTTTNFTPRRDMLWVRVCFTDTMGQARPAGVIGPYREHLRRCGRTRRGARGGSEG